MKKLIFDDHRTLLLLSVQFWCSILKFVCFIVLTHILKFFYSQQRVFAIQVFELHRLIKVGFEDSYDGHRALY